MDPVTNGTPSTCVPFEIDGQSYLVRVTLGTVCRMQSQDLDFSKIGNDFSKIVKIVQMCLGTFENRKWVPIPYSPDELAELIEMPRVPELMGAIAQAMGNQKPTTQTVSSQTTSAIQ